MPAMICDRLKPQAGRQRPRPSVSDMMMNPLDFGLMNPLDYGLSNGLF